MTETVLDGTDEEPAGHRILEGTDLEIAYNISGDNLVLRVNKGPVQIFRVMLVDACKDFTDRKLFDFNQFNVLDFRDDHLSNPVAGLDCVRFLAKIDDYNFNFSPIIRINGAGGI